MENNLLEETGLKFLVEDFQKMAQRPFAEFVCRKLKGVSLTSFSLILIWEMKSVNETKGEYL